MKAGIAFWWRIEQAATGLPVVRTHLRDPAAGRRREGDVFTGVTKAVAPFPVEVDLGVL